MRFFGNTSELPAAPLAGSYDPWLVLASYLIAAASAYVALMLLSRMHAGRNAANDKRLRAAATVSLGFGVWSMHFVGMLAFALPIEMHYGAMPTALSLALVLGAVHLALRYVTAKNADLRALVIAGLVTGIGIASMHYTGMAAMRMDALVYYHIGIFLLSIGIAVAAAIAALWLGLRYFAELGGVRVLLPPAAAAVMGVAIAGMHYTGMAATAFVPAPSTDPGGLTLDRSLVTYLIVALMIVVLCVSSLIAATDRRLTSRRRLGLMFLLLAGIAIFSSGIALVSVYDAAFKLEKERLAEGVRMQAQLIDAVARFDAQYSADDVRGGAAQATLGQVRDAQQRWQGFGNSGELYLVKHSGGWLEYVVSPRLYPDDAPLRLRIDDVRDVPALRAGSNQSGTVVDHDYRGVRVLAAYGPVAELAAGLVIKLDMAEFREPYARAGAAVVFGTAVLLGLGLWLVRDIAEPVVEELKEKHRLEIELDFARQVQQGLLPAAPPVVDGYEFAAKSVPARFVGGDFFDFKEISEGTAVAIIGDVSGKGVSAALHMARLISDFRYACEQDPAPAAVLHSLNGRLHEHTSSGMFASAICVLVDGRDHTLRIANAGHHAALLVDGNGAVEEIAAASGPPLGVVDGSEYATVARRVADGHLVLLYTDGVTEARDEQGREYGFERLRALVAGAGTEPEILLQTIEGAVSRFAGTMAKFDDLTLLAFARRQR